MDGEEQGRAAALAEANEAKLAARREREVRESPGAGGARGPSASASRRVPPPGLEPVRRGVKARDAAANRKRLVSKLYRLVSELPPSPAVVCREDKGASSLNRPPSRHRPKWTLITQVAVSRARPCFSHTLIHVRTRALREHMSRAGRSAPCTNTRSLANREKKCFIFRPSGASDVNLDNSYTRC